MMALFFHTRWTWRSWMDLALLTHLCQALVPLVDSGSNGAFLGMSCFLERVVPHPKGFVYLFTGNSGSFPPQPLGRSFVVRANFVGQKKTKKVD